VNGSSTCFMAQPITPQPFLKRLTSAPALLQLFKAHKNLTKSSRSTPTDSRFDGELLDPQNFGFSMREGQVSKLGFAGSAFFRLRRAGG
jgi:hypothetical protein